MCFESELCTSDPPLPFQKRSPLKGVGLPMQEFPPVSHPIKGSLKTSHLTPKHPHNMSSYSITWISHNTLVNNFMVEISPKGIYYRQCDNLRSVRDSFFDLVFSTQQILSLVCSHCKLNQCDTEFWKSNILKDEKLKNIPFNEKEILLTGGRHVPLGEFYRIWYYLARD